MARIRRAQEKGKAEVKLSKDELAAFERRRQREEEEEERKKRREQRIAVPLSQFESGPRKKRNSIRGDSPTRRHSLELSEGPQQPPAGYFPPSASRSLRPPVGTGSSLRTPSRAAADRERAERGDSPFTYSYVHSADQSASSVRHASDPSTGRPLSRTSPRTETASPPSRQDTSQGPVDVFKYMTGGASAPYHSGDKRQSGGTGSGEETDSDSDYVPREEKRVSSSGSGTRGRLREEYPAAEERPRHEPERRSTRDRSPPATSSSSKKSSVVQPPVRRKSVVSSSANLKSKRKVK